MADIDYPNATAGELVAALAARKIGTLELTDVAIARIEATDGPINAVVVRDFDRAREAAKAADAALARGERAPLLGLPMTVKESHNVAGLRTTWGTEMFGHWIAPADNVGVARLKAAGAVILGKTNVPPFLSEWQSDNPIYGRTNNPLDLTRSPGGSSGGAAAALAAGMVALEYGSDIGGSIRVPAAFCGVYGHKPSHGVIPLRGHTPPGIEGAGIPLAVVGPLARSAADLALAMSVLAGPDADESVAWRLALPAPRHTRLADYRVLLLTAHPAAAVDAEIVGAIEAFGDRLAAAGAKVSRQSPLLPDLAAMHGVYMTILTAAMGSPVAANDPDALKAFAYQIALHGQAGFRRAWAALFETVDVVIAPCLGSGPFPHATGDPRARTLTINGEETAMDAQLAWAGLANLPNLPATAMPIGRFANGLPIGAQVIGPYLEDRTTMGFAGLAAQ
jgi:amidase